MKGTNYSILPEVGSGLLRRTLMAVFGMLMLLFVSVQVQAQTIPNLVDAQTALTRIEAELNVMAPDALSYSDNNGLTRTQFNELRVKYTLYKSVYHDIATNGLNTVDALRNNWVGQTGQSLSTPQAGLSASPDNLSMGTASADAALMDDLIDLLR